MDNNQVVKLMFDFMQGPIWPNYIDGVTFEKITGVKVVDEDAQIKVLNEKACDMYSSYYEFDSHVQACWFNEEQQYADRFIMLDLLEKIASRLDEINDGSYVVEPIALEEYRNLCKK